MPYTVPEIVPIHVNRIIKLFFDIIEGEVKVTKCSEPVNVGFPRFPDFIVYFCGEFQ
jgi:hypothetical protein